jgi:hypothetical protein
MDLLETKDGKFYHSYVHHSYIFWAHTGMYFTCYLNLEIL